jgi:uncharacterized protein (DUF433 family)
MRSKGRGHEAKMSLVINAYTTEQASRLTDIPVHRLRHWSRTDFFVPSMTVGDEYLYSFRDLLSLRVLRTLRMDIGCSLQHLREVRDKLAHMGDDVWSRTTLYVLRKKVVFPEETGALSEVVSGQRVFPQIVLSVVRSGLEQSIRNMAARPAEDAGKIERKRNVNHNRPVLAGTRIPVAAIKRLTEDGYSPERIIAEYPSLRLEDISAALRYKEGKRAA